MFPPFEHPENFGGNGSSSIENLGLNIEMDALSHRLGCANRLNRALATTIQQELQTSLVGLSHAIEKINRLFRQYVSLCEETRNPSSADPLEPRGLCQPLCEPKLSIPNVQQLTPSAMGVGLSTSELSLLSTVLLPRLNALAKQIEMDVVPSFVMAVHSDCTEAIAPIDVSGRTVPTMPDDGKFERPLSYDYVQRVQHNQPLFREAVTGVVAPTPPPTHGNMAAADFSSIQPNAQHVVVKNRPMPIAAIKLKEMEQKRRVARMRYQMERWEYDTSTIFAQLLSHCSTVCADLHGAFELMQHATSKATNPCKPLAAKVEVTSN